MDLAALKERLGEIGARRVILTHMGEDMLSRSSEVDLETAEDGKIVDF